MTDARDPIRRALLQIGAHAELADCGRCRLRIHNANAALDSLRVVQPGEVVLSAEQAGLLVAALGSLAQAADPSKAAFFSADFLYQRALDALLSSGPDREAEA